MAKTIALLPMKANSKRVPGKNFRDFCGKPLFRWVLDTLLGIPEVDVVVINTDAREILIEKGLKESSRIIIQQRPKELCGDEVSMNLIIADDIKKFPADIFLMTHTTNPLLSKKTILEALNKFKVLFKDKKIDSLFTVNKIQTRFYNEDGIPINHDPNNLIQTQNLEPWYEENSNLYIFTAKSFSKTGARIGLKPYMLVTPRREAIDIDTQEDWNMGISITSYLLNAGLIKR